MTTELYWLTLTVLLTAFFWVPYLLDRMAVRGILPAVTDRGPEGSGPQSLWAKRAIRAHQNAIENLMIFAPAVLVAHELNISTPVTRAAAATYFFARLLHFVVYSAGVPLLRTLTFTVGWIAQLCILASILGWI
jgi:uncharacterized MAPEG superfamily protein